MGLVRELIDEIRIIPRGKGEPAGLEVVGDLAALMVLDQQQQVVTASVVAGARNSQHSHRPVNAKFLLVA